MKKYLKVLIVLVVVAVLGGAAWLTNILLYCPFLPEAVSAGSENYAVVHKISDKWVVSVIDKFGEEVQYTDFPSDDKSEQIKLIYSDEMYYLWRYNPETGRAFVNNIIYGESSEKENEVVLKAKTGETFFGVNGSDETISAVGVMEQDGMAEITVYLAGITAPEFKVSETYSFRGEFLIRDALYCADGSVMFLTADGIIYRITNQDRIPRVYYNCAENVPQSLMLDGSGKLCVWNSDNRAFRINEDKITEPCLEDMISELVYNDAVHSLNECISVSVQSDDFSAIIHEKNDGTLCLETYCNGMLYTKSETDYVSWWKYVLVYLLIILAVMIISVLLMSVRLLLRDTVKMKTRLLVLCVAGFCIVASVVTVYTVSVFTAQKTEQKWERLTIMLNQMSIFLHADEQTDYQWLINEKQGLTAEQHQLVEKLETMSENKTEGQSTFILFVRDENGKYISVSGSEEYINKAPELIYTPSAGYRITGNSDSDENLLSLNYRKGGALWMMMVQKLYTVSEQTEASEPSALLVMQ
ncbi:MAG: hypothetical protein IJA12_06170, partial [Oscillospiraceae bacterium]|nr:hypothetical protein [Oscillospiraceae bacterium]